MQITLPNFNIILKNTLYQYITNSTIDFVIGIYDFKDTTNFHLAKNKTSNESNRSALRFFHTHTYLDKMHIFRSSKFGEKSVQVKKKLKLKYTHEIYMVIIHAPSETAAHLNLTDKMEKAKASVTKG